LHGFVPIDAFGVKRKREEEFDKEIKRPQLPNVMVEIGSKQSSQSLNSLHLLVSLFSENEEENDEQILPPTSPELIILD
jgi:hypothetical protein